MGRGCAADALPGTRAGRSALGKQPGHSVSVATAVGFIALSGVAAEFGVVMLGYLQNAWQRRLAAGEPDDDATLLAALREGALTS